MPKNINATPEDYGAQTLWIHKKLQAAATAVLKGRKKAGLKGPRNPSQLWTKACIDIVKKDGRKYGQRVPADLQK